MACLDFLKCSFLREHSFSLNFCNLYLLSLLLFYCGVQELNGWWIMSGTRCFAVNPLFPRGVFAFWMKDWISAKIEWHIFVNSVCVLHEKKLHHFFSICAEKRALSINFSRWCLQRFFFLLQNVEIVRGREKRGKWQIFWDNKGREPNWKQTGEKQTSLLQ